LVKKNLETAEKGKNEEPTPLCVPLEEDNRV